jgi:hypothetical protein
MHFPALLLPLWWGAYQGRQRRLWLLPIVVVGLGSCLAITWGESNLTRFWASTWENLEGSAGYGSSPFGMWGVNPLVQPLKPLLRAAALVFTLTLAWWPRGRRGDRRMAALAAAVLLLTQLWKTHAGGQYITWYLPLLLIARLVPDDPGSQLANGR